MEKISNEAFGSTVGTDTIVLLVSAEGVVTQRQTDADKTISRFDAPDNDAAAREAIQNACAHYLSIHTGRVGSTERDERTKLASDLLARQESKGATRSQVDAVKAAALCDGLDIDGYRAKVAAEVARAEAEAQVAADAEAARVLGEAEARS